MKRLIVGLVVVLCMGLAASAALAAPVVFASSHVSNLTDKQFTNGSDVFVNSLAAHVTSVAGSSSTEGNAVTSGYNSQDGKQKVFIAGVGGGFQSSSQTTVTQAAVGSVGVTMLPYGIINDKIVLVTINEN